MVSIEDPKFDDYQSLQIADKKSKTTEAATRAMFSFKSELNSLIGNLQETTQLHN